ncbi:hypothetical protein [Halorussus sp. AFM4]|uniref:hypothetical protein n=1 Tax=Halorussus sp. AFM4 TaxID=3421651 RepID=UPI003EB7C2D5
MSSKESSRGEAATDARGWEDSLAYGEDSEVSVPAYDAESDHWDRWHYGLYLAAAFLVVGAVRSSLPFLFAGFLLAPAAMYLDARYLDSVTPNWQPDTGLHLVGTLLFPFLMIPAYLYRRREL